MIAIAVCCGCAALIVYILFGYPLILGLLARWFARPVKRAPIEPSLSVIIAVRNGERYLRAKLDSVLALDYPRELVEIIVVSDGSSDGTAAIAREFEERGVRLVEVPAGGKPAALNAAIPMAKGEILILTDVRQALDRASVRLMVESFADPSVGTVSGELHIRAGSTGAEASVGLYWRFEKWIRNCLSSLDSMFGATGSFYAIRRELAVAIPEETLLDDMYLPLTAFFRGYRLTFDRRARAWDEPVAVGNEFHRKVRTLAGNYQLLRLLPELLSLRNRMWFHFLSYKVGRLVLPWAMTAFFVACLFVPRGLREVLLAAQILFYGLAGLDRWLPETSGLKKLSAPVATFVVMMAAAAAAVQIVFVRPQTLWKETTRS